MNKRSRKGGSKRTRLELESLEDRTLLSGNFGFAAALGSTGIDEGRAVATDTTGNVYIAGSYEGTVDFDPGAGVTNLTSQGSSDIFVAKYTAAGSLLWARNMGGAEADQATGIAVDSAGNVYTTGFFTGSGDFDPFFMSTYTLSSAGGPGDRDIFVSKLNASGNFVWAKSMGGSAADEGTGIAVDSSGNVHTTGFFTGSADFDPFFMSTYTLSSAGGAGDRDIFVSKLDVWGNFVWAKGMGGFYADEGRGIALDSAGNVYTTGFFRDSVDFDPGFMSYYLYSAGSGPGVPGPRDIFVSKLDTWGNFVWARNMGGSYDDEGQGIVVDSAGNVYTTGFFRDSADFDPGVMFNYYLYSAGSAPGIPGARDIFVSKLDTWGNFVWARNMGGTADDEGNGITLDSAGNVYTTGFFTGSGDFDPAMMSSYTLSSAGGPSDRDIFVSKLDAAGNFVLARKMGGTGTDESQAIAVFNNEKIYTTGSFEATADFDPGPGVQNRTSAGGTDLFLSKLEGSPFTGSITDIAPDPRNATVGSVTITFSEAAFNFDLSDLTLTRDGGGNLLFMQPLTTSDNITWTLGNLSGLTAASGTYQLSLLASDITSAGGGSLAGDSDTWVMQPFTGSITDIAPDPRNTTVGSVTITFSEAAFNFDLSDLSLTRDGGGNLLTGAQTLTTSDNITWTLGNLSGLTAASGFYQLSLLSSDVTSAGGGSLTAGENDTWTMDTIKPTVAVALIVPDPRFAPVFSMTITFSEAVSNFDLSDLSLTRDGGGNLLTGTQTLTTSNNIVWTLGNLADVTGAIGAYQLDVAVSNITDSAGNALATGTSRSWTMTMNAIAPNGSLTNMIGAPTEVDTYSVTLMESGRLTVQVTATGGSTLDSFLTLYGPDQQILIQSDDAAPGNPSVFLEQHLLPGTYYLGVSASAGNSTGGYNLGTQFVTATPPFQGLPAGVFSLPDALLSADFNGDGRLDLVTSNISSNDVSVMLGNGDGTFGPQLRFAVGDQPRTLLSGDFNGDGRLDLATANFTSNDVSVLLGNGNGTFAAQQRLAVGNNPRSLLKGDFNGDGWLDLVTANLGSGDVSILLGNGNGTFAQLRFAVGDQPRSLLSGDFNGDGRLDLATGNWSSNDVSILLGNGNGTFAAPQRFAVGNNPHSLLKGDFNGDGRLDLATANLYSDDVSVLLGNGNGAFAAQQRFTVGDGPQILLSGDFNGDGRLDLASANYFSADVSVLLGNGNGIFAVQQRFAVGLHPESLLRGDFNGDGRLDLATANQDSNDVSLLLGNGDGTFMPQQRFLVGSHPGDSLLSDDFNADGRLDLATANYNSENVSVLLNNGDGTFAARQRFVVGIFPGDLLSVDFNGDGRLDVATANRVSNDVSVLLSNGDGSYAPERRFVVGSLPSKLLSGDFNRDSRLDLVTVNSRSNDVSVLLGNGDGTFAAQQRFAVGNYPVDFLSGDFNADGRLDLASANFYSDNVSVLLGTGDGSFTLQQLYVVGDRPRSLLSGDFNGDGRLDLAVANSYDVSVLLGNGDGTFAVQQRFGVGVGLIVLLQSADFNGDGRLDLITLGSPGGASYISVLLGYGDGTFAAWQTFATGGYDSRNLLIGDFNSDGRLDVATTNFSDDVSVLLGNGDGTFAPSQLFPVGGTYPTALLSRDFNGDGHLDLATANSSGDVSVLLGTGNGTFAAPQRFSVGFGLHSILSGDFNGDGRIDLITANSESSDVSVLLGKGDGTFIPPDITIGPRAVPFLANVDNSADGTLDSVVLNQDGEILFRAGVPGQPGAFEAPRVVNPGQLARDITVVNTGGQARLAAVDKQGDAVSLYTLFTDGSVTRVALPTLALPARIAAGDLNADGADDLVVTHAFTGTVSVFLSTNGSYAAPFTFNAGTGVLDVELADIDGSGTLDILATNQIAGDVIVARNLGAGVFAAPERFRAGQGLYGVEQTAPGSVTGISQLGPAGIVAGNFTADASLDLVVTNLGINSFTLLQGKGTGSFVNPGTATLLPQSRPTMVVSGDFNQDARADLAVLDTNSATIWVLRGDGMGGFTNIGQLAAGNVPTGLSVADVNGDLKMDLLAGNEFGDVMLILGNGDGTFRPFVRADSNVTMVTADINGDGVMDAITVNQATDQVTVQIRQAGTATFTAGAFSQDRTDGLQGPGNVKMADLNNDGLSDLVVANSGSNNVLVYLGTGAGQFSTTARSFFAGTNPVGLTIQDLNNDTRLDLAVANEGSNDVSILFGQGTGGSWTLTMGPRLNTGAGPSAIDVRDQTGDGINDLIVTNAQAGTISVLAGIGNNGVGTGFFNDVNPLTLNVGAAIRQAPDISGLLVTQAGAILRFNPTAFNTTLVFGPVAGREVEFVRSRTVAGSEEIFAARADGSVSRLEEAAGQFSEVQTFTDPRLADISMLEIISDTEIYITNEGDNVPVVLNLNSTGLVVLTPGPGAFVSEVVDLSAIENSLIALTPNLSLAVDDETGAAEELSQANLVIVPNLLAGINAFADFDRTESGTREWSFSMEDVRLIINQAVDYFNLHVNVADHPITGGIFDTAQALIAVNRAMLEEFGMDEWPAFDLRLQDIVGNVAQALYEAGQGTVSEIGQRAGWQPGRANKPVLRRAAPAEEAPPLRKIEEEPMDKESSLSAPLALTAVEAAFLDWSGDQPAAVFDEEEPEPVQPLAASFASAIMVCGARPGCKKSGERRGVSPP